MNSLPPVYVSTACLRGSDPLLSRISSYTRHHLFRIELGAGVTVTPADLNVIQKQRQIDYLIHNYFPPPHSPFVLNLASEDLTVRARSIELVSEALYLSAQLGATFYSVHAGFVVDPVGFGTTSFIFPSPDNPHANWAALGRFVDALQELLVVAEDVNVQILVENNVCPKDMVGKLLLQTPDEFKELFRLLPSSALGILLDTGHLNVSAHTFAFDCVDFVNRLKPRIRAWHLHNNDGIRDLHLPVVKGDWMLKILKRNDWSNTPVVIEARFDDVQDLSRYAAWLEVELSEK